MQVERVSARAAGPTNRATLPGAAERGRAGQVYANAGRRLFGSSPGDRRPFPRTGGGPATRAAKPPAGEAGSLMCDLCAGVTAKVFCRNDQKVYCKDCDKARHAEPDLAGHDRYLLHGAGPAAELPQSPAAGSLVDNMSVRALSFEIETLLNLSDAPSSWRSLAGSHVERGPAHAHLHRAPDAVEGADAGTPPQPQVEEAHELDWDEEPGVDPLFQLELEEPSSSRSAIEPDPETTADWFKKQHDMKRLVLPHHWRNVSGGVPPVGAAGIPIGLGSGPALGPAPAIHSSAAGGAATPGSVHGHAQNPPHLGQAGGPSPAPGHGPASGQHGGQHGGAHGGAVTQGVSAGYEYRGSGGGQRPASHHGDGVHMAGAQRGPGRRESGGSDGSDESPTHQHAAGAGPRRNASGELDASSADTDGGGSSSSGYGSRMHGPNSPVSHLPVPIASTKDQQHTAYDALPSGLPPRAAAAASRAAAAAAAAARQAAAEAPPQENIPAVGGRRCVHCGGSKTPQWRAGPAGAKTLCNACGVRFKAGRLQPAMNFAPFMEAPLPAPLAGLPAPALAPPALMPKRSAAEISSSLTDASGAAAMATSVAAMGALPVAPAPPAGAAVDPRSGIPKKPRGGPVAGRPAHPALPRAVQA